MAYDQFLTVVACLQALGWFVSHCGQNSTLEAVSSGVPVYVLSLLQYLTQVTDQTSYSIAWPFQADQPANAVSLTEKHDVAYELFEVRIGNGLKTIYRTGKTPVGTLDALRAEAHEVLDKAFGEDGARKRANMKELQAKVHSAWDKGGSADVDMEKLLDTLT